MASNPDRRAVLLDAAIEALSADGGRALSFRGVDRRAHVPTGTTSNYFAARADLFLGVAERTFELLTPEGDHLTRIADGLDGVEAAVAYVRDVVARLLARPDLAVVLIELRLEARRDEALRMRLEPFLRAGLDADRAFHASAGLPGDGADVALLHHAVNGLVLDRLTVSLDPDADPAVITETLARRIVGGHADRVP